MQHVAEYAGDDPRCRYRAAGNRISANATGSIDVGEVITRCQTYAARIDASQEARYAELKLDDAQWSDDQLIDFMVANPILINRPIVVTAKGTRLCRPAELVQELL